MFLKCPNCGFSFGFYHTGDITEDELEEIKTCPCGTMMLETEHLEGMDLEVDNGKAD